MSARRFERTALLDLRDPWSCWFIGLKPVPVSLPLGFAYASGVSERKREGLHAWSPSPQARLDFRKEV